MKKLRNKYRLVIIILTTIGISVLSYGYLEYTRELPDTGILTAVFNVQAADLVKQFEASEPAATLQYGGKVISVHGVVDNIDATASGTTVLLNDGSTTSSVMCQFSQETIRQAENLQKGRPVTIKGICTGYLLDVVLVRCVIE